MGETSGPGIEEYQRAHKTIMEALVGPDQWTDGVLDNARAQLDAAVSLLATFTDPTKVINLTSLSEALVDDTPDALRKFAARVAEYEPDAVKPPHEVIEALGISGRPQDNIDYMKILSSRVMKERNRFKIYEILAPKPI